MADEDARRQGNCKVPGRPPANHRPSLTVAYAHSHGWSGTRPNGEMVSATSISLTGETPPPARLWPCGAPPGSPLLRQERQRDVLRLGRSLRAREREDRGSIWATPRVRGA
jgi:hypothetical protein